MPPAQPSWFEHIDLIQVVLVACLGYIAWSFNRGLTKFEKSQDALWKKVNDIYTDFSVLHNEHKLRTSAGASCTNCHFHRRSEAEE